MNSKVRQSVWALIESLLSVALPALSLVLLGHLLSPTDYGVFSLAFVLIAPVNVVMESLLSDLLLLQRDDGEHAVALQRLAASGFGWSLVLGAVLALALALVGPAMLTPEQAASAWPMRVLALSLLLSGLYGVPQALVFKQGQFKALAGRTIVARILALTAGASLAHAGAGAWALVAVQLLNQLINTVVVWRIPAARVRPSLALAPVRAHAALLFKINANNLASMASKRAFILVVASQGSVALVGVLEMASRITDMLNGVFSGLAKRLALPIFLKPGTPPGELANRYWRLTTFTACLALPPFGALVVGGPWLLGHMLGDKWVQAGVLVTYFALAASLHVFRYFSFDLANMRGRAGLNIVWNLVLLALFATAGLWADLSQIEQVGRVWLLLNTLGVVVTLGMQLASGLLPHQSGLSRAVTLGIAHGAMMWLLAWSPWAPQQWPLVALAAYGVMHLGVAVWVCKQDVAALWRQWAQRGKQEAVA